MPSFGRTSKKHFDTLDTRLQEVLKIAIQVYDFAVFCGTRSEEDQNDAYFSGKSKVMYPNSKHNKNPSLAVDIMPWFKEKPHIRWDNTIECERLSKIIKAVAISLGHEITWGGSWKNFPDFPHYEV